HCIIAAAKSQWESKVAFFWAESSAYSADAQEFLAPRLADGLRRHGVKFGQSLANSLTGCLDHFLPVPVGPAYRLGHDAVDAAEPEQVLAGDLHVRCGIDRPASIPP